MGMNSVQFKLEMRQMQEDIKDDIANTIKDAVSSAFENSLKPKQQGGAPKISGWLRSNIYVTLNVEIKDTIGSKEAIIKSRRDRLFRAFKNEHRDRILRARSIFITYTVPYASYVNDGSSKQAGQHFIERSIQGINNTFLKKGIIR